MDVYSRQITHFEGKFHMQNMFLLQMSFNPAAWKENQNTDEHTHTPLKSVGSNCTDMNTFTCNSKKSKTKYTRPLTCTQIK